MCRCNGLLSNMQMALFTYLNSNNLRSMHYLSSKAITTRLHQNTLRCIRTTFLSSNFLIALLTNLSIEDLHKKNMKPCILKALHNILCNCILPIEFTNKSIKVIESGLDIKWMLYTQILAKLLIQSNHLCIIVCSM